MGIRSNRRYVTEYDIVLSDVTENDSSVAKHGFLVKLLDSSNQFLDGEGNWRIPSGIVNAYTMQAFSNVTSVNYNFGAYPLVQVLDNSNNQLMQ